MPIIEAREALHSVTIAAVASGAMRAETSGQITRAWEREARKREQAPQIMPQADVPSRLAALGFDVQVPVHSNGTGAGTGDST